MGLSVLFMAVYNATLYFANQRSEVPTWCYDWELINPFVRWMIVPYMSIDLFFFLAPFLCVTPRKLTVHTRRITFCILVAGLIFYIYPLRLVWERTPIEGWLGVIYNPFIAVDIPFNLLPSLHIALRTVLAELYVRKTAGPVRWLSHVWFSLIGFSTLLIHQHHIVDVIGGFALGAYALYFYPLGEFKLPTVPNPRIATLLRAVATLLAGPDCRAAARRAPAVVAGDCGDHCDARLRRVGPRHLSQSGRALAVEFAICARANSLWAISFAPLLPAPMPAVG